MGLIGIFLPEKKHIPFSPIKENISLEEGFNKNKKN